MKIQPHTPLPGPTASPRKYATPLKRSMKAEADIPIVKSLSVSRPKPSSVTSDKENEYVAGEVSVQVTEIACWSGTDKAPRFSMSLV